MKTNLGKILSSVIKSWVFSLAMALIIATSVKSSLADWNDIPSGSMLPTILIGDRVFVNKLAYDLKIPYTTFHIAKWSDPKQGEIVVFYSPEDGKRLIKRVIGAPGDTIAMRDNRLLINGQIAEYSPLQQQYIDAGEESIQNGSLFFAESLNNKQHTVMFLPSRPSLRSFGPVTIPEGKYFMMGDNRDNSADSRYFGFVDRKLIIGQATTVVISRDKNFSNPRWSRFFEKLI